MRILLATHAFPPRSTAGVEVYTLRLARALRCRGHDVRVLTAVHDLGAEPGSIRRREEHGLDVTEVVNVHHLGTLEATYEDPVVERAAGAVVAELRPEVAHFQHLLNLSAGLPALARRAGARVLLTLHDYWLSCPRDGLRIRTDLQVCRTVDHAVCARCLRDSPYLAPPLQSRLAAAARGAGMGRHLHRLNEAAPAAVGAGLRLLRRLSPPRPELEAAMDLRAGRLRQALEAVDVFLAPTRFARDRALEAGVRAERLVVAPLGAVVGPVRARPEGRRRRFGFVGSVLPHKGVHVLVEAFRRLEGENLRLDVHGGLALDPRYSAALRRSAAGDRRIRFRGPFPEGGQASVLSEMDVLVAPSLWWENSPLTVLEALAAGVPVVASAIGGVPELVEDGVSGILVPPGDAAALRAALADITGGHRLASGLEALPIRSSADEALELESRYASLAGR